MKFGHFDDAKKEYVITSPKTPLPWINYLGSENPALHTDETLIALSMSAATDENAALAMQQLPKLRGCQVHTSCMLAHVDEMMFKKLGVELTSEPVLEKKKGRKA